MTWFYSHYGLTPPPPPPPGLLSWVQTSLNSVELTFELEPKHINPYDSADCLDIDNYVAIGPLSPIRLAQYVEYLGDNTVRLWFDGELVFGEIYEIEISNLESVGGTAFASPASAVFTAFFQDAAPVPLRFDTVESWDLANPQVDRDSQGWSLGTLGVDETGDTAIEPRRASLRKRIIRRCTTKPGAFIHLENYGLRHGEKKLIRPSELRRLKQDAEFQIAMEPDVISVRVLVQQTSPGVVWLTVLAEDKQGRFTVGSLLLGGD